MSLRKMSPWMFSVLGAAAVLLLQLHFILAWDMYARVPYPGTTVESLRDRTIPPWLTSAPLALRTAVIFCLLLPLTLWFARGRWRDALAALWGGVMLGLGAIYLATERLRSNSDLWPFTLVYLAVVTGAPMLLGGLSQAGLRWLVRGARSHYVLDG